MKIIDFHTHPFIKGENCSCFYEGVVTADNFREIIEKAGISKICGSVIRRTEDFEEIKKLNREALKLKEKWGDFYVPGIHIHPKYPKESVKEMEWASHNGIKLVGELVPYMNDWKTYYDDGMEEIYSEAEGLGMIFSVHTDPLKDYEGLVKAVKRFKNITFVAAHPHQREHFYKHIEMLKGCDNYYLDLSGTGLFRYGMLKTLVNAAGDEKILFGTDFPISNPKMYTEGVLFEDLSDEAKEKIFYKNAERILL